MLLVDDNEVNQVIATGILRRHGFQAVVAPDGCAAVAAFERMPFDLILMDVEMPVMNGFQAAAEIRRLETASDGAGGQRIPIIAMTASAMTGDRERCLAAGMDDYVAETIRARDLIEVVARVVDARRRTAGVLAPATPEDAATPVTMSRDEILEYFNGDVNLLREVAASFRTRVPQLIGALAQSLSVTDAASTSRAAHAIKGLVGFLGAREMFAAAQRIEMMGRAGDLSGANEAFTELERQLQRLLDALPALTGDNAERLER